MDLTTFKNRLREEFFRNSADLTLSDTLFEGYYNDSVSSLINNVLSSENPIIKYNFLFERLNISFSATNENLLLGTDKVLYIDKTAGVILDDGLKIISILKDKALVDTDEGSIPDKFYIYQKLNSTTGFYDTYIKFNKSFTGNVIANIISLTWFKNRVSETNIFDNEIFELGKQKVAQYLNLYSGGK